MLAENIARGTCIYRACSAK